MKKIKLFIVLALTGIDLFSKLCALIFLEYNNPVSLINGFSLNLYYNESGSNSLLDLFGFSGERPIILLSVFFIITGSAGLIFNRYRTKKLYNFIFYFLMFLLYFFFFEKISNFIPDFRINIYLLTFIRYAAALYFGISFLLIAKDKGFAVIWAVFVSAGIGNFLNYFHPPFAIIDFLYCDSLMNHGIGIFNLADIYIIISMFGFILYLIIYLAKKIIRRMHC